MLCTPQPYNNIYYCLVYGYYSQLSSFQNSEPTSDINFPFLFIVIVIVVIYSLSPIGYNSSIISVDILC